MKPAITTLAAVACMMSAVGCESVPMLGADVGSNHTQQRSVRTVTKNEKEGHDRYTGVALDDVKVAEARRRNTMATIQEVSGFVRSFMGR